MNHIMYVSEACDTHESVVLHIRISRVTRMNKSRHTYEWIMWHIWLPQRKSMVTRERMEKVTEWSCVLQYYAALQCVAVCCIVLRCAAVCFSLFWKRWQTEWRWKPQQRQKKQAFAVANGIWLWSIWHIHVDGMTLTVVTWNSRHIIGFTAILLIGVWKIKALLARRVCTIIPANVPGSPAWNPMLPVVMSAEVGFRVLRMCTRIDFHGSRSLAHTLHTHSDPPTVPENRIVKCPSASTPRHLWTPYLSWCVCNCCTFSMLYIHKPNT